MGFLGVYRAIYDYAAQAPGELTITEGDLLFVLEKSTDDDWWKAKKKAVGNEEEEPEGLIPNNYIEEVQKLSHGKTMRNPANAVPGSYQSTSESAIRIPETNR